MSEFKCDIPKSGNMAILKYLTFGFLILKIIFRNQKIIRAILQNHFGKDYGWIYSSVILSATIRPQVMSI